MTHTSPPAEGEVVLGASRRDGVAVATVLRDVAAPCACDAAVAEQHRLETVRRIAGGIAHDYNNLLTAIVGAISLARAGSSPEVREDLATALAAAERATRLTRQLQACAKEPPLASERFELNDLLHGQHKLLRRLVGEDVRLSLEFAPGALPVQADIAQLEQALVHVVLHVADSLTAGGHVRIETGRERIAESAALPPGDYAVLRVAGVSNELSDRVERPPAASLRRVDALARELGGSLVDETADGAVAWLLTLPLDVPRAGSTRPPSTLPSA